MKRRYEFVLVILLSCIAVFAGCGKSEDSKPASQVAAKVNSDEITIHQVNYALARSPQTKTEGAAGAKRQVLEKLIDQHLAKQQAVEQKLDRAPDVVQAMEAAKTEILARAYVQHMAAEQPKPTSEEVSDYYAKHPELFAQRRLFGLEEISTSKKTSNIAGELKERIAKARSMQEIAEWLKSRAVPYSANRGERAAEQIPLNVLPELQSMKDGDIRMIETSDDLLVVRLVVSRNAPVDEAAAAPRIQQFLLNQRSSEVIAKEMKRLKEQAKIQYVGEFAAATADTKPTAAMGTSKATETSKEAQSPALNVEGGLR